MPNPFNVLGNGMMNNTPMSQMIQSFNQFKSTFQGDPQQTIQQLLNSGRISQDQLNQAMQMAKQFKSMMPK